MTLMVVVDAAFDERVAISNRRMVVPSFHSCRTSSSPRTMGCPLPFALWVPVEWIRVIDAPSA